jgi:BirA family biotin operon repressor/biotin-[acetyl-CoA-carboxylase] ligase
MPSERVKQSAEDEAGELGQRGHRICGAELPADISSASLRSKLKTRFIGRNILYYPVITSTMDEARVAAAEGAEEGTIVLADEQTAGKGRLKRQWFSPPGDSILLSIILRPELAHLSQLTMVAALAVAQTIEKVTGLGPAIKWPNDVLIEGRKVSGILIESQVQGGQVKCAIVGIGLNVNLDPSALPQTAIPATSLRAATGHEVSRLEVLTSLLQGFEELYQGLRRGEPIHQRWMGRLETLGKKVRVSLGDRVEEGYAESVDERGNLVLRRPDESLVTIVAGDVTLRS